MDGIILNLLELTMIIEIVKHIYKSIAQTSCSNYIVVCINIQY
jgi:hypothetical protein